MKAMARHRTHSIEFKRRVVEEYLGGNPYDNAKSLPPRKRGPKAS